MLSSAALSPESLSLVLEQSADCVKLVDPEGRMLWMNRNGRCAMEIDDFHEFREREWVSLWPEESRDLIRSALVEASGGKIARIEAFCPTAKGTPRWWEVSVSPVTTSDGIPAGFISISRDVSQQHADREAQRIVMAEMRHRLKNSFTIVCSMLSSIARGDESNAAFFADMVNRISALARAQTLFEDAQQATDLHDLLDTLVTPFRDGARKIVNLDCQQSHEITREQADVIALVIGELTVNSTKHGAIDRGGQIDLTAMTEPDWHVIHWRERSDAKVTATSRAGGQGLSLIQRICKARGGTFDIEWAENGFDSVLRLPLVATP